MTFVAAALCAISTAAKAERWALVTSPTENVTIYVDADSIVRDTATATIWVRTEFSAARPEDQTVGLEKWIHDCGRARAKLLAITMYDFKGAVKRSSQVPRYKMDWVDVASSPLIAAVHDELCTSSLTG